MYSKYGSMRLFSSVIFLGLVVGLVMYKERNVLKNIKGSILEHEVHSLVSKNPKVNQLIKLNEQKGVDLDHLIGGGIANNEFKCVMLINNINKGRLYF